MFDILLILGGAIAGGALVYITPKFVTKAEADVKTEVDKL